MKKSTVFFILLIIALSIGFRKFKKPKAALEPAKPTLAVMNEVIAERNYSSVEKEQEIKEHYMELARYDELRRTATYTLTHYNFSVIDPSFIYKHLPSHDQYKLKRYNYLMVDKPHFSTGEAEARGITVFNNMLVIVGKDNSSWCGTKLTMTERILIHEMAHVLVYDDMRPHEHGWANKVKYIVKQLVDDEELAKKLTLDITGEVGWTNWDKF